MRRRGRLSHPAAARRFEARLFLLVAYVPFCQSISMMPFSAPAISSVPSEVAECFQERRGYPRRHRRCRSRDRGKYGERDGPGGGGGIDFATNVIRHKFSPACCERRSAVGPRKSTIARKPEQVGCRISRRFHYVQKNIAGVAPHTTAAQRWATAWPIHVGHAPRMADQPASTRISLLAPLAGKQLRAMPQHCP
jgi:hypothetical protein